MLTKEVIAVLEGETRSVLKLCNCYVWRWREKCAQITSTWMKSLMISWLSRAGRKEDLKALLWALGYTAVLKQISVSSCLLITFQIEFVPSYLELEQEIHWMVLHRDIMLILLGIGLAGHTSDVAVGRLQLLRSGWPTHPAGKQALGRSAASWDLCPCSLHGSKSFYHPPFSAWCGAPEWAVSSSWREDGRQESI